MKYPGSLSYIPTEKDNKDTEDKVMKKRCFSSFLQKWDVGRKILLTMKLTCVLTVFFTISAMGVGIGQTVNLKLKRKSKSE